MHQIQTYNKIASKGLDRFPREKYEVASEFSNPDAIVVRSASLQDKEFGAGLKAIARAGAGVNNIPVDACSERGIIVFNTPGANANGVKELVFAGMFLAARNVYPAMRWLDTVRDRGDEVPKLIESEKSKFKGSELRGKTLGIIGLGAIGAMVANDAVALGMKVIGWDPFISVDSAWGLSRSVKKGTSVDALVGDCDYLSIHVPLTDETRGMLNRDKFALMRKGMRILNFARGGLVNNTDLKAAMEDGTVAAYVTDFPDAELLAMDGVIGIPHLGASTFEAEENCAVMAVDQLRSFLETGNITNSVNFPTCEMEMTSDTRIVIANRNIPNMVGQITTILAEEKMNISDMLNRHKNDYAYTIIDVEGTVSDALIGKLKGIDGVIMVRIISQEE
jgi:D-3-phosphoglycerate dehydrogenase